MDIGHCRRRTGTGHVWHSPATQYAAGCPGDWDLTIVPLLGFDRRGYRLGYGKGYYDRLLAVAPTPTIGLAFAMQEVEMVPTEPHDLPLTWVVTEHEVIAC
ncbi:MAG: 5-formyltetrahydrofolate cyclo-ligase [Chloroflexaceae bacterium]|nr:5-formyltetrahydrofolate cyclo-ligase [Chloroflexaceae bacterium]